MVGLIDDAANFLDEQGSFEDRIPEEEEEFEEARYRAGPHQMASIRLRDATILAGLQAVVASHLTRRKNFILKLRQAKQL